MFQFIKKRKYLLFVGIILSVVLAYGGNKIYKSIFVSNNNASYSAVSHTSDTNNPGYILANSISNVALNNPYIIQGDDENYYLFGTKGIRVPSQDENQKLEYYVSSDGKDWFGPSQFEINGINILGGYSLPISPKVYLIGDYYYALFTLINMNEGQTYNPYDSRTTSSVYYAVAQNLNAETKWTFKGEVPFGTLSGLSNFKTGDTSLVNYNHMNGSLLVDDKNFNGVIDDNETVNFYYHLEDTQESYGIKLKASNGELSYDDSTTPSKLLSKDIANADVIDDPYVVYDNGEYKLFCSTKETNNYTYNVIQANSKNPLNNFDVVDNDLISLRHSGGLSIFQTKIKDVIGGETKYYNDNYYVFHRNTEDVIESNLSVANQTSFFVRKDIKNENEKSIIPRFSGQKLLENTDYYRNSISKEKYTINGEPAIGYTLPENTANKLSLKLDFNSRMMVREVLIYTDSFTGSSVKVVPDINVDSLSTKISVRSKVDGAYTSYYTANAYGGVIRVLLPLMINNTSTAEYAKNIQIVFNSDVGKINDIQVIGITSTRNEYDNYFYVKYDTKGVGAIVLDDTDCTDKLLKSTELFTTTCNVVKANYDYTYSLNKDVHYNKVLTDDYAFDYMFKPTIFHVYYDLNGGDTKSAPKEVKFATELLTDDENYKDVILYSDFTLPKPTKTGYNFNNWINLDKNVAFAATTISGGKGFMNFNLKADWTPLSYNVVYYSNKPSDITWNTSWGSSTTKKTIKYNYDDVYRHPDLSLPGYELFGWYTEQGDLIKYGDIVKLSEPISLYAYWSLLEYKISFNLNDSTGSTKAIANNVDNRIVIYNQEYGTLPTPTRTGYTFGGWVIDDPSSTTVIKETSKTIEGDHILYAKWNPTKVTVSYNANGGSCSTASNQQTFDAKYVFPSKPTKTGYDFVGWYTAATGGTLVNTDTDVINPENHTLYAHWEPKKFTLTLDLNKGSGSSEPSITNSVFTITYDDKYTVLDTIPTRDGYDFVGWYTSASGGTLFESSTVVSVTSDQTLYAHWTPKKYKVTIDYQNGSAVNVIEMNYDTVYSTSNFVVPTRTNYVSQGWFDAATGGNAIKPGTSKLVINKDHTIYLQWRGAPQKITYNYNGGKVGTATSTTIQSYYQENYILPEENPVIAGKRFLGWYTAATGGFQITSSTKFNGTAAQTLYAHWDEGKFIITFDSNGGSLVDSKEVIFNEEYGELPIPTKVGYDFSGWWSTATFDSNTQILPTSIVAITKDSTLFAKWTSKAVNVNYDKNDGSELTSKIQYFNTKYSHPSVTRTGYTFAGWYTAANGGTLVDSTTLVSNLNEHTLYAHWNANKFTIEINANGGECSKNSVEVSYDGSYSALPTPTRAGYSFTGWYTAANGGTKYDVSSPVKITSANGSTIKFFAHWEANTYIVSFNANGGTTVFDKVSVTFGKKYGTLPTVTRTGYTFNGWYDSTGIKVTSDSTMNIPNDSILTAQWTAKSFKVTFISNGGTLSSTTATVTYDSKYGVLPTGTRNGYELIGWVDEYGKTITSDSIVKIDGAHNISAKWKTITYTITYGEKKKQYTIETPSFVLDAPDEKKGYEFLGYTGEGLTTPTKTVTITKGTYGDKKYEASWKAVSGDAVELVTLTKKTGMSSSDFLATNKLYNKVLNKDGSSKPTSDLIKTGDILVDKNNKQTRIIISMDVNGDGKVTTLDYVKVWNHLDKNNPSSLNGEENKFNALAADVNGDGKISTLDYVKIWNKLLNF